MASLGQLGAAAVSPALLRHLRTIVHSSRLPALEPSWIPLQRRKLPSTSNASRCLSSQAFPSTFSEKGGSLLCLRQYGNLQNHSNTPPLSSPQIPSRKANKGPKAKRSGRGGSSAHAASAYRTRYGQDADRTEPNAREHIRCIAYRTAEEYDVGKLQQALADLNLRATTYPDAIHIKFTSRGLAQPFGSEPESVEEPDERDGSRERDRTSTSGMSSSSFALDYDHSGDFTALGSSISQKQKHVFIFQDIGAFVCWGTTLSQERFIRNIVRDAEEDRLMEALSEDMDCYVLENGPTRLSSQGNIILAADTREEDRVQEQLAFSQALAISLELDQREDSMEDILGKIEPLMEDILKRPPSAKECRVIMAQEITLRRQLNLHSNLMDTPEMYWEEHDLERIFENTRDSLDIPRRIAKLNSRLEHLHQMIEVLKHDRQERLSTNLELWIIALIGIEIVCLLAEKSELWENFRWEHLLKDRGEKEVEKKPKADQDD